MLQRFSPLRLLAVVLLASVPASGQDATAAPTPPREEPSVVQGEPAPVVVWNRQIVVLRANAGRLSSTLRAQQAVERVLGLPEESLLSPVEMEEVRSGTHEGRKFSVEGRFLLSVFDADIDEAAGESLATTAEHARERLAEVLQARVHQRSLPLILRGVGLTLAATLALFVLLWAIALAKKSTIKRVRTRTARSERLRVRNIDLRPYVAEILERLVGVFNLVLVGTALYLWLGYSLARFPYTAPWSSALGAYIAGLLRRLFSAVAAAVPDLVIVAILFFVTRGCARTITLIVSRIERRAERADGVAPESVRATRRIAVAGVWIFGIVLAYPHLPGAQTDAFKGVSVLLGVMVSFGSAGLINQVMSGFVVLYSRAVRTGDVVRIGEIEGQVTELGMLTTKVLQPSGEEISIPNAVVITKSTTNFSRGPGDGRAVAKVPVTIGYDTPWRQVRGLLLLAAERTEGVVRDPAPRVAQHALSDWFVEYELIFQVEDGKQRAAVLSRIHAAIQDAFNEFGVQIMSPHFVAQPEQKLVVPRGGEEPAPAPRFRFAKEAPPASFDPVEKAAQERAERAAEEAAKAERARLRAEREAAEEAGPEEDASESGERGEPGEPGSADDETKDAAH